MNWKRGLFRLWLMFSALFVVAITVLFLQSVRNEFYQARLDVGLSRFLFLPVDCNKARGTMDVDYEKRAYPGQWEYPGQKVFCTYKMEQFRILYPEHNDLTDSELARRVYENAGLPIQEAPAPWTLVLKVIAIAVGVPLIILVIGVALLWSFAGFAVEQKAR
jgi:hypothetical protein